MKKVKFSAIDILIVIFLAAVIVFGFSHGSGPFSSVGR